MVLDIREEMPVRQEDGTLRAPDLTRNNPMGIEFDHLYLDMNGIIHTCFHPESSDTPQSEDEVFTQVGSFVDRLFCIIRPRRTLYIAIDGVAPRAKMNQQRLRRYGAVEERLARDFGSDDKARRRYI